MFGETSHQRSFIGVAAISVDLVYMIAILVLCWQLIKKSPSTNTLILCVALAIYTGGIPLLGQGFAKMDAFLGILVLTYYFLTTHLSQWGGILVGIIISVIGILIHEIWLFLYFPLILSIFILRYHGLNSTSEILPALAIIAAPNVLLAVFLFKVAVLSSDEVENYYWHLLEKSGYSDTYSLTGVDGFFASVKALGNGWLPIAFQNFFTVGGLKRLLSGLIVVWPVVMYWMFFSATEIKALPVSALTKTVIIASPFVGFLLFPIALDYGRYWGSITYNMLLLVAFVELSYSFQTEKNFFSSLESSGMLLFVLGWTAVTGPLEFWGGAPTVIKTIFQLN